MTEAELRDHIAANIQILEPGLILLSKEKYIPNEFGTKGFIDLYARDPQGHHVLIELKRSNAASREAIHEIHKYVEGVKQHLGARDEEIRVIVASTEWRELLVPYSRFVVDSRLAVVGMQLDATDFPQEVTASKISPLPINQGRFIAPWHDVNWYLDEESLRKGIASIEESCKVKGIQNFIVVVLRPPAPVQSEHQATMWQSIRQAMAGSGQTPTITQLPAYKFIAYFAMQLTQEECLQILADEPGTLEDARESIEEMDPESALQHLHELVSALGPRSKQDHLEIGYPAKFTKFLDSMKCATEIVYRHGIFARNTLLSNESIFSELRGEDGSTGQRFKRTVSVANKAHLSTARTDIGKCLDQNPVWRSHIMRALDEIELEFPDAEVDISIFNPATGILTLYFPATRDDGILYIPSYSLLIRTPEPVRMYYGALESIGTPLEFQQLLDKYYESEISIFLLTMTWGGYEARDLEIIEDLGLAYRSFRCDAIGAERNFYRLRDERWRPCEPTNFLQLFSDYVQRNEDFVSLVIRKISERSDGGLIDASSAEAILDGIADQTQGESRGIYFVGAPENCDICGQSLANQKYMADSPVAGAGSAWACMCADCFVFGSGQTNLNTGQLYLKDDEGWLLVSGFPEEERDDLN